MHKSIFSVNQGKRIAAFFILILFSVAIFFSTYKLTESPPTWMDEGVIVQTAKNLAEKGVYGLQIAPHKFVSSGFVTTSYPVIYPLALSFKLFGVGIFQARIVMVLFLLAFFTIAYFFTKKEQGYSMSFIPLSLIVSFAPLYGHGKNVLGEIPGLFFLLYSLFLIRKMEISNSPKTISFFIAGAIMGLSMVTKPIFLDLLSFSLIISFLIIKPKNFSGKKKYFFVGGVIVPLIIWIAVHFSGDNFSSIISNYYGNPDQNPLLLTVQDNFLKFFKEFQLVYFTFLLLIWVGSVYFRKKDSIKISFTETVAVVFSVTNFFAFFATLGYNRYFFPGQVLSIIYLPSALFFLYKSISLRLRMDNDYSMLKFLPYVLLSILILFQFYQTIFHSWVADNYGSRRSADLKEYFSAIPTDKVVMFYDVPEAVLFTSNDNYFQYMRFAENVQIGRESVNAINSNMADVIITSEKSWKSLNMTNDSYKLKKEFDKYQIFERIKGNDQKII